MGYTQITNHKIFRIMTDGDREFLARLVASHKRVISEGCKQRKLDDKAYFRRAGLADKKAREIERDFCKPRRF